MLEQGEITLGVPIVVLGTGPIAVTVVQGAKAAGASPLIVTRLSLDKDQPPLAKSLGADETIDVEKKDPVAKEKTMTGGLGAAKVFEVSGSHQAFQQGLEMLLKMGKLLTFGIYPEDISIDFSRKVVREMKVIRGVRRVRFGREQSLALYGLRSDQGRPFDHLSITPGASR
jgi:threonine dehydrogenase-like Zn-dependent dehydrogenase